MNTKKTEVDDDPSLPPFPTDDDLLGLAPEEEDVTVPRPAGRAKSPAVTTREPVAAGVEKAAADLTPRPALSRRSDLLTKASASAASRLKPKTTTHDAGLVDAHHSDEPRTLAIRREGSPAIDPATTLAMDHAASFGDLDVSASTQPHSNEDTTSAAPPPAAASYRRGNFDVRTVRQGAIIGDRYRIEERLATSEMSVLFRAIDVEVERMVVVKLLHDAAAHNAAAVARFKREAQLMDLVKSHHVAQILDVGAHQGCPFIVMEQLEGADLAYLLARVGKLPLVQACDLVLQICEGLAVAHAHGIVHRDLKPANIFVSVRAEGDLRVTIIDFGIAKAFFGEGNDNDDPITHSEVLLGSPRYMAPEQVQRNRTVDTRVDIWALGVLFQEILTGQRVFDAEGVVATLIAIVQQPHVPLRTHWPEAPEAIVSAIEWALAKDRERRMPNVLTFAAQVAPFANADAVRRIAHIATLGQPALAEDHTHIMPAAKPPTTSDSPTGRTLPLPSLSSPRGPTSQPDVIVEPEAAVHASLVPTGPAFRPSEAWSRATMPPTRPVKGSSLAVWLIAVGLSVVLGLAVAALWYSLRR